jgi:hypothetical protein
MSERIEYVVAKIEWSKKIWEDECIDREGKCVSKKWKPKPKQRFFVRIIAIIKNVTVIFKEQILF